MVQVNVAGRSGGQEAQISIASSIRRARARLFPRNGRRDRRRDARSGEDEGHHASAWIDPGRLTAEGSAQPRSQTPHAQIPQGRVGALQWVARHLRHDARSAS